MVNKWRKWTWAGVTGWGGVHVAVLHPASGVPLASRSLPTAKPSEARVLARFLGSLQPGRILVLAVLVRTLVHCYEISWDRLVYAYSCFPHVMFAS
ncbi:uncharacterized protein LOC135113225 isoform X3 [Scylla paramamosain]|uniref:uncharacterized protein LOC135113225 isoform X3 n=1 Tax=Scylla paramamosain TaxID=85552 RepID=UPI00308399AC